MEEGREEGVTAWAESDRRLWAVGIPWVGLFGSYPILTRLVAHILRLVDFYGNCRSLVSLRALPRACRLLSHNYVRVVEQPAALGQ